MKTSKRYIEVRSWKIFALFLYGEIVISLLLINFLHAAPITISGVPEYTWTYGCAPTAAAEIMGYYDGAGYGDLMGASGWQAVSQTGAVMPEIASLSAAMRTTGTGSTNVMDIDLALVSFTLARGYNFTSETLDYREFSWLDYTGAIDAGRPVLMSVDSNADWNCDHAVTAIGYDDRGIDGLWYGFYTGWQETEQIRWERFQWAVFSTEAWGISFASFMAPGEPVFYAEVPTGGTPVPEPASVILLGIGLVFIAAKPLTTINRRRKQSWISTR